jgi:hypothetical protein
MSNETNETTDAHGEKRGLVLLRGEGGIHYLLPVEVLEAFKVDDSILAALRGDDDVAGYLEGPGRCYAIYFLEDSSTLGFLAGCLWADFTRTVSGSTAKFEVTTDRAVAGVRG